MNAFKDRIAEAERAKERKRARVEKSAGDVPVEPWSRADEQVAVRHADASGGDIRENQHDENRTRDIHVGKRGPEAAGEEPDMLRKTDDLSKKLRMQQRFPIQLLLWNILRVVNYNVGRKPYLCRRQVMLTTTYKFLRWMHSMRWMDERVVTSEKCWNEDAGDLKSSELNELIENLTCLNALDGKFGKVIRRS